MQIRFNLLKTIQWFLISCKAKPNLLGMTGFALQVSSLNPIPGIQLSPDLGADLFLCNLLPGPYPTSYHLVKHQSHLQDSNITSSSFLFWKLGVSFIDFPYHLHYINSNCPIAIELLWAMSLTGTARFLRERECHRHLYILYICDVSCSIWHIVGIHQILNYHLRDKKLDLRVWKVIA